ncbi:O-acyltransferase like protein-like isoform X2 [Anoplophora glabripennis]|uniref:O-acyltransferase like protein-like isoform X2 n=1 Tax=Anoplophora glabripennis TaxID=217634 RepID=UPI000C773EA2|nr:O-acyltransferase like protein-like isoform X2 [Anoplophora glabripennis]
MFLFGLLYVLSLFLKLCTTVTISDDDYKLLPQLYDMDDYNGCNRESNEYCKIKLVLMPIDRNSKLWKLIETIEKEKLILKRDVIYRAKCLAKEFLSDRETTVAHITQLENKKLENMSLHAKIESIKCKENMQDLTLKSYFVLWLLVGYLVLLIFATVVDILSRKNKGNHAPKTSFRILTMWLVVGGHSIIIAGTTYVANTKIIDYFLLNLFGRCLINFSLLLIQSNFLMSGWLRTIQIYNDVEKSDDKKLSVNVITKTLTARYLRFVLPLIFYIGLTHSVKPFFHGPQTDLLDVNNEACRTHWWANLLLINNFFYVKDMCNIVSWYLSCDFQAHVVSMALFYLMYKWNFGIKLFGAVFLCIVGINTYILYNLYTIYNLERIIAIPTRAEYLKLENILKDDYGYYLHTSFFQNFSSYIVGILFGAVYHRYKDTNIEVTKTITVMWTVGFCGLPALASALCFYDYEPLVAAVIGSLVKPLFALGIGIGMLGISHNIGGFVKRLFEASPLEFISRWNFSIYLFHILIIFYNTSTWTYMLEISYFFLVQIFLSNILLATVLGLILHLIIERPLLDIKNVIISKWAPKQKTN